MRHEHHFNTPAQVREYLAEALAIVSELEFDDELRVVAFTKAIDLVAGKQIIQEEFAPALLGQPRL